MAIALLPLMEGETLGSNFGRYAELMRLRSTDNLRRSLFGYACVPCTRLPSAMDHLAQQTRDYWNLTGEEIIRGFTEFQYVTMMCSQPTREKLLGRMLAWPCSNRPPLRLTKSNGERMKNLRYCLECLAEWRGNREPFYWKIDHQLTGVYYCIKHSCILKSVGQGYSEGRSDYNVLQLIGKGDETILNDATPFELHAIENVARLSVRKRMEGDVFKSARMYRDLFRNAGFARADSGLKQDAVISAWLNFFGSQYCHMTGMSTSRIATWVSGLSDRAVRREFPHPFMFIAAECFLEHNVSSPGTYLPRGRGDLPALSGKLEATASILGSDLCKGALHRDGDVIRFAGLLRRSGGRKLVCTCGISYRMLDATKCEAAKLTPFSYGSRYQTRFSALIAKGMTPHRAARELHITRATALKWAGRKRGINDRNLSRREVNKLRTEWRLLVKGISSGSRITTAAESNPILYKTLKENDREWLITFNREHRSWRPQSSYTVNEPTTDEIRESYLELMLVEPPIRGSKVAILEKAGFRGGQRRNRSFAAFLEDLAESRSAYRERVISWLATQALKQQFDTCDEALRRAGLRLRSFTREQRSRIREIDTLRVCGGQ
ncbi:TnsD family Tn7-like transposition protein [Paraburkholderia domus]|uniref:Transposon Tn7 transposition protein TnsD C-termianl domain-containing protein n=1 Tax=Paraburkholderia domus TaxID=2793075 RepID=A0A9N8MM46_9BURK|nr:TnsD family Tn7-like transposition protein [Paraburkholderia domus]MBK5164790.1 TniQ family protein [Burkholderia sp. R-70211]CAE6872749.1 hypothetical protein R70211_01389 [Paraburkholderia domus]